MTKNCKFVIVQKQIILDIIVFGQLTEITGNEHIPMNGFADTNSVIAELNKTYPELVRAKYLIAVDKNVVTENTTLTDKSIVALLPPFSGG